MFKTDGRKKMMVKEEDFRGLQRLVIRGLFPKGGNGGRGDRFVKNNNIRNIKKVYKIISRLSDGVVDHKRMEEDFEENIDVMVCQEESIDVDVDKKAINHSKACAKCGNSLNECS